MTIELPSMIDSVEKDNQDALFALLRETKADHPDAWPSIISLLYHDLKKIAHRLSIGAPPDRTLNTTSLVNECYLKIHSHLGRVSDRGHLLALSARVMRQVMCDLGAASCWPTVPSTAKRVP